MEKFIFKKIDFQDKQMMEQIYRLRFQVYCNECGFIKEEDYPEHIESDEYDPQSVHFAAISQDGGEVIGTMRLILPGARVLPVKKHCPDLVLGDNSLPEIKFAEISRLIISKRLRRRKDDGRYYEPKVQDDQRDDQKEEGLDFFRRAKPMAFGLYRELYRESKAMGITHWYTLMEKSLWLLLRLHGFNFSCIGEEVNVYGAVRPYLGKLEIIEKEVAKKFPQFFDYFTEEMDAVLRKKSND